MSPVQHSNDHVNNRQKILDAATNLVMEKGVKGTSLADIAHTAEISKGTLFYYFSAKDDLIYELTEQHFNNVTNSILKKVQQMQGESLEKILYECLLGILVAEDRGKLNLYLLQEAVIDNPALRARFRDKYREYLILMDEFWHMLVPEIDPAKSRVLGHVVVALLDGLIIQWLLEPEAIPVERIAEILSQILK